MSRTVELGRAVLASSTQDLELWLTTLITISPSQHSINLQQLPVGSLLQLLSSGDVWVGRGHGMCVEVDLTLRGEPLPYQQFHDLVNSILEAPVWSQLKLQPTLPTNTLDDVKLKTARFNINHVSNDAQDDTKTRHRLFSNVPAADVQPPEGVPKIALGTIRFCMDILETKQRPQLKRSRTSPGERCTLKPQADFEQSEERDLLLHALTSTPIPTAQAHLTDAPQLMPPSTARKRKRLGIHAAMRTSSSSVPSSVRERGSRRRPVTDHGPMAMPLANLPASEITETRLLIDGAMRLSVCTNLNKTSNGLKVKANTFAVGLADVAPVLWRPGYLLILSQRAHLLPSISRAIGQAAGVRATSISLRDRLAMLQSLLANQRVPLEHVEELDASSAVSSSLACRLWLQMQKSLSIRSTPPLQSFVSCHAEATADSDFDGILVEAPISSSQEVETMPKITREATRDHQSPITTNPHESLIGEDDSGQFGQEQHHKDMKPTSQPCFGRAPSDPSTTANADQKYFRLPTPCVHDDEILLDHHKTHRVHQRDQRGFDDDLLLDRDHNQPVIDNEDDLGFNATQHAVEPGHGTLPPRRDAEFLLDKDLLFEGHEAGSENADEISAYLHVYPHVRVG